MICHSRDGYEAVPGCTGRGTSGWDYCIEEPANYDYYQYTNSGTTSCSITDDRNWQGPAPFSNKGNVAVQFFAFGDTPYDKGYNTCIENGRKVNDCSKYDCTTDDMGKLPSSNTCTYEGEGLPCL